MDLFNKKSKILDSEVTLLGTIPLSDYPDLMATKVQYNYNHHVEDMNQV